MAIQWQGDGIKKCDLTRVNEADVVRVPNCDFAVNVFNKNQK